MPEQVGLHRRPEYRSARDRFLEVAEDFGVDLGHLGREHLTTIITLIDLVDQHYDSLSGQARAAFGTNIVEYLAGRRELQSEDFYGFSKLGLLLLEGLSSVLDQRSCRQQFSDVIAEIFRVAESTKSTDKPSELVDLSVREGELTADAVLMVVGATREDFVEFVRLVGRTGNLADDLMDAREDAARGERACDLGAEFYIKGSARVVSMVARIIAAYPRKLRLLRYLKAVPRSAIAYSRE